jgi:hypothetical protein
VQVASHIARAAGSQTFEVEGDYTTAQMYYVTFTSENAAESGKTPILVAALPKSERPVATGKATNLTSAKITLPSTSKGVYRLYDVDANGQKKGFPLQTVTVNTASTTNVDLFTVPGNYATGKTYKLTFQAEKELESLETSVSVGARPKSYRPTSVTANVTDTGVKLTVNVAVESGEVANGEVVVKDGSTEVGKATVASNASSNAGSVDVTLTGTFPLTADKTYTVTFQNATDRESDESTIIVKKYVPDAENLTVLTLAKGTAPGTTKISTAPGEGNDFVYVVKAAAPQSSDTPKEGDSITEGTLYTGEFAVTAGKVLWIYEVDSNGKVVKFGSHTVDAGEIK